MISRSDTVTARSRTSRLSIALLLATVLLGAGVTLRLASSAAEEARAIPGPAVDPASSTASSEVAVLAGGCFWGVQGVFQHVAGVTSAVSGYAGGAKETADYERVSSGMTGHAESVQVTFDPGKITYGRILQIYFLVAHDPTQLNRQGPDTGTQYRSAIFPRNAEQAATARAYIAQLDRVHAFDTAIVTRIEPDRASIPRKPIIRTSWCGTPHIPISPSTTSRRSRR